MAIKHAAWTHGTAIALETSSWTATRRGFYTIVRPSSDGNFGWVHFAIPTPVIVDGNRLKAVQAGIRFSTGSGAKIISYHVYDGEKKIADYNGLSLTGTNQVDFRQIPNSPRVLWGTGISLGVQFSGNGPNDYIQLISGGIDFYD